LRVRAAAPTITAVETFRLKRIDDLAAINNGAIKLAGDELGVESFGLQVLDLPAGFADYPEHDHAHDGQEEVYLVLEGTVELTVAGDRVEAGAGTIVRVAAEATRRLVPGPGGVRVVAIGCTPGGYERPAAFRVEART
jgi:mannose-6-phosphate isomerase-like protein (cupin superfamily)